MKHFFIGIAGGSGCGKSTLAYGLKEQFSDLIEVVHFDDYQKEENEVSLFEGMKNWDHPDAINFDKLYADLLQLKNDQKVSIMTKSSVLNPDYEKNGRINCILVPKKIVLVEGYMCFQNKKISDLFDYKIYLDLAITESMKRRTKITYNNESEYNNKILIPMHKKFVEPSRKSADLCVDVLKCNKDEVLKILVGKLRELDLI